MFTMTAAGRNTMTHFRYTLNVLRRDGKALQHPDERQGVYCETHNQITFAWLSEGEPAAHPLHNAVITLHPNGLSICGFERQADTYQYQEWWLVGQMAHTPAEKTGATVPSLDAEPLVNAPTPSLPPVEGEMPPASAPQPPSSPAGHSKPSSPASSPLSKEVVEEDFPPIHWDETLEMGVDALDADHRELFQQANALIEAVLDPPRAHAIAASVLDFVDAYMDRHFEAEEELMRQAGFPGFADHCRLHDRLRTTARQFIDCFQDDPDSLDLLELLRFMRRWLVQHVEREDQSVRPYLDQIPVAAAPGASDEGETDPGDGEDNTQAGDQAADPHVGAVPEAGAQTFRGASDALRQALDEVAREVRGGGGADNDKEEPR